MRARLRLDPRNRLGTDAEELVLADGVEGNERVVLLGHGPRRVPLSQAAQLVLSGDGYASESEAEEGASRWIPRLRFALAGSLIGADFGLRSPTQHITPHGLEWLADRPTRSTGVTSRLALVSGRVGRAFEVASVVARGAENRLIGGTQAQGRRVLQDVHGTQIFECEPRPVFALLNFDLLVRRSPQRFLELIAAAAERDVSLSAKEELGFELFSGSFFEPTADGRFLMLMMAVEALTVAEPRAEASVAHIDRLIADTQAAALAPNEKEPLVNALRGLKRESISSAGQRLAQTLGDRSYQEHSPTDFFKRCYGLRSRLVHPKRRYPSFDEINGHAGALELFVRDLLTLPLST